MFAQWMPWLLVPALAISALAQLFVQYVLARASGLRTKLSGYAVARHVLDGAGRYEIQVEQVPGAFCDYFDQRRGTLQLSEEVYHGRSVATQAFAAHEASHALQSAGRNRLLVIRELAVSAVTFGSGGGVLIAVVGLLARLPPLLAMGIALFSATLYLQLLSLPIELSASRLAQQRLVTLGLVEPEQRSLLRLALLAAALTDVGATLQGVLTICQRVISLVHRSRPS